MTERSGSVSEWMQQRHRLGEQQHAATSSLHAAIFAREDVWTDRNNSSRVKTGKAASLKAYWDHLDAERQSEVAMLNGSIQKIKKGVASFVQRLSSTSRPTKEFVDSIRTSMEELDGLIRRVKSVQKEVYEVLMTEEDDAAQDLERALRAMESWDKEADRSERHGRARKAAPVTQPRVAVEHDVAPEVQEYEDFVVQNGGLNGGWQPYDHGTFVRIRDNLVRAKLLPVLDDSFSGDVSLAALEATMEADPDLSQLPKGLATLCHEVSQKLAAHNHLSVLKHEAWYRQLHSLNTRKKAALEKWRREKQKQEEEEKQQRDAEQRRRQLEARKRKKEEEQQRLLRQQEAAEKVREWRLERQQEQQEWQEQEMEKQRQQQEAREQRRRERQQALKQQVETFAQKKQREEQERVRQAAEEQARLRKQRQEANQAVVKFRERDERQLLERKEKEAEQARERAKREAALDRLRQQVASQVQVDRDPARLLQLNEAARQRHLSAQSQEHDGATKARGGSSMFVMHAPRLATPAWRKGI